MGNTVNVSQLSWSENNFCYEKRDERLFHAGNEMKAAERALKTSTQKLNTAETKKSTISNKIILLLRNPSNPCNTPLRPLDGSSDLLHLLSPLLFVHHKSLLISLNQIHIIHVCVSHSVCSSADR